MPRQWRSSWWRDNYYDSRYGGSRKWSNHGRKKKRALDWNFDCIPDLDEKYDSFPNAVNIIDDTIDLDPDLDHEVLFGSLRGDIVGVQYYEGTVNDQEMVSLVREPHNRYDSNAIKVNNIIGQQVGHIKRELAKALARVLDCRLARVEGVIPYGSNNRFSMPVELTLYGQPENKLNVTQHLRKHGYILQEGGCGSSSGNWFPGSSQPQKGDYIPSVPRKTLINPSQIKSELDSLFEQLDEGDKVTETDACLAISTALFPHQKQALGWMIRCENIDRMQPFWQQKGQAYFNTLTCYTSQTKPKTIRGGLLADDMGLGKTLEVIALILTNFVDGQPLAVPVSGKIRASRVAKNNRLKIYRQTIKAEAEAESSSASEVYHQKQEASCRQVIESCIKKPQLSEGNNTDVSSMIEKLADVRWQGPKILLRLPPVSANDARPAAVANSAAQSSSASESSKQKSPTLNGQQVTAASVKVVAPSLAATVSSVSDSSCVLLQKPSEVITHAATMPGLATIRALPIQSPSGIMAPRPAVMLRLAGGVLPVGTACMPQLCTPPQQIIRLTQAQINQLINAGMIRPVPQNQMIPIPGAQVPEGSSSSVPQVSVAPRLIALPQFPTVLPRVRLLQSVRLPLAAVSIANNVTISCASAEGNKDSVKLFPTVVSGNCEESSIINQINLKATAEGSTKNPKLQLAAAADGMSTDRPKRTTRKISYADMDENGLGSPVKKCRQENVGTTLVPLHETTVVLNEQFVETTVTETKGKKGQKAPTAAKGGKKQSNCPRAELPQPPTMSSNEPTATLSSVTQKAPVANKFLPCVQNVEGCETQTCDSSDDDLPDLPDLDVSAVSMPVDQNLTDYSKSSGRTRSKGPRATLIVCPLSTLSNWLDQLEQHVDERVQLQVYTYYGTSRTDDHKHIGQHDIVLTTYQTLAADHKGCGTLQKVHWLRVVLDEGHLIRNANTQMSKAAFGLRAGRKWVVTGTPIQNSIKDLWSVMNFLNVEPFQDKQWWYRTIEGPIARQDPSAIKRVKCLLASITMRRMKTQIRNGKPIVELPKRDVFIEHITLSDEERQLYDSMQNEGKLIVSKYFKQGTLLNHYGEVLAIMVRLRQMCCHPFLVAKAAAAVNDIIAEAEATAVENNTDDFRKQLIEKILMVLNSGSDEDCPICLDSLKSPVITHCAHLFCRPCIERVINSEKPDAHCPMCRGPVDENTLVEVPPDGYDQQNDAFCSNEAMFSSSKVDALMNALTRLRCEDGSIKSIVVSQFTSFLTLLEKPLRLNGFRFARLDGTMSSKQRTAAIEAFSDTDPNSPTVFLLSLKAGGVGINLTAACRIFLMDPAWNPASEEQCFDRCHRLGQTRDVVITKFIVENSVEERLLQLQDKKRKLAAGVFGGGAEKTTAEERRNNRIAEIKELIDL